MNDSSPAINLQPTSTIERGPILQSRKTFPKYTIEPDIEHQKKAFFVRRILNNIADSEPNYYRMDSGDIEIYPLIYTSPPRTELEIKIFGR